MGLFEGEFVGNSEEAANERTIQVVHFVVVEVYLIMVFHDQR